MPIEFKIDALIYSRVMTVATFKNIVPRKMRLKLEVLIVFYKNSPGLTVMLYETDFISNHVIRSA